MNRHDQFEELLARRSELSPAEEARLEEHLRDCPECRATAEAYARQTALLRAMPLADPPPALLEVESCGPSRGGYPSRALQTTADESRKKW